MSKLLLKKNRVMRISFLLFSLVFFKLNYAQPNSFAIGSIPVALKQNAHTIKREESIEFEVKEMGKAIYKVNQVITLLNENAQEYLNFYQFIDKFKSLEEVTIELLDANGIVKKKYLKSDLTKQATGEGLVPDGKVYFLTIPTNQYPLTLKIGYEIKFKGILNYPTYDIQLPNEAVEKSTFKIKVPIDLDVRFKPKNTVLSPTISIENKLKIYSWSVQNLPAFLYEVGSVSRDSRYPQILLAPNKFTLDDYEGDMTSWQSFGKWYGSLAKDASDLSTESKLFYQNLVKSADTEKEKIKLIYSHLQNNFRYVSIQLGIGGFKPFTASFVDKKKYGDCKALSNYMQACLSAIGIKSYQALINAGYNQEPVNEMFTINKFNHVIVCVPQKNDSIWLECTSTTNDFNRLGNFTENKNALLITEDGGKLVATPISNASDNTFTSITSVQLNADGSGTVITDKMATGEYKQNFNQYIVNQKKDDQKKYLVSQLGYVEPTFFELVCTKGDKLKLSIEADKLYDFAVGSKLFINPRMYKIWSAILPNAENRTQDFYFEHPFIKTDTTIYNLPNELGVETLPKNKTFSFSYGSFTTTYDYEIKQKKITVCTKLFLQQPKIPVAKYAETKQFFDNVVNEFSDKIVLKKL